VLSGANVGDRLNRKSPCALDTTTWGPYSYLTSTKGDEMQTDTSPVVQSLISSVLSEMLDENGSLRKASECSPCCCVPGCYTTPDCEPGGPVWPEG
jgi:hypothetical protein